MKETRMLPANQVWTTLHICLQFYTGYKKIARPNLQKLKLYHNTRRKYNMCLLKRAVRVTTFWGLQKTLKVCPLCVSMRALQRQASAYLLHSTTSDCGYLPRFPMKRLSRAVARYGSADYSSFTVHSWCCFTNTSSWKSGILEQHASPAMNRMRWINSVDFPFPI